MKMKTLFLGVVSGFLLSACGGPTEAEPVTQEELGTAESALCEGWDSGARRCTFKCTSSSSWWWFAPGEVSYGNCTEAATYQCGFKPYATCWSK